ncbi:YdiU family protein [Legionella sp. 16cNR16C]|uniref:protein adenylyltransferase SelO n=1 Tax=Legionella sp. 16cNR16C TaxID=2905656 RepID=UPI001E2A1FE6|nr:YdiU family protein [Legionella sp. 16cNR16C]MCE3044153.1 YdiU family protein [Legionella sp. 16cNR16C]
MPIRFDNSFTRLAPLFYSRLQPTPVARPELVHFNNSLANQLGLGTIAVEELPLYFSGNKMLPGSESIASVYSGHQFGYYVSQLGDGRAHLLGEILDRQHRRWDLQLKGSGKTPYSRMGDGRAVLQSTIREYLCSEAMHALGIPTSRALCITATNEPVYRYTEEPGAILTRVSESLIRFGHFEYFYYTNQLDALKQLADYVLARHYPECPYDQSGYEELFRQAVLKTAELMALWQAVGFCHGVMNTDNMSIIGLTIDYGPFGFLDSFDFNHICNSSDESGRYAYNKQPAIAYWNLQALAQALTPLIPVHLLQDYLSLFETHFQRNYLAQMRAKLGLFREDENDRLLVNQLLSILHEQSIDYTIFFRWLADRSGSKPLFSFITKVNEWLEQYEQRLSRETASENERKEKMMLKNPKYILRNYLAQQAIDEAYTHHNFSEIDRLFKLLKLPYEEQPDNTRYADFPPGWSKKICVSCSS